MRSKEVNNWSDQNATGILNSQDLQASNENINRQKAEKLERKNVPLH